MKRIALLREGLNLAMEEYVNESSAIRYDLDPAMSNTQVIDMAQKLKSLESDLSARVDQLIAEYHNDAR